MLVRKLINKAILLVCIVIGTLTVGCNDSLLFSKYNATKGGWGKHDSIAFTFEPKDTTALYDLYLNIRNDNNYAYSNIFIITELTFPDNKVITDTLQYEMANPDGSWLGTGVTDLKENKLWYKEGVRFPLYGSYTLQVNHAMRKNGVIDGVDILEGITDVGFSIEQPTTN